MRHTFGALFVALAVAAVPTAEAQELGLELGLGGFHGDFLLDREANHVFNRRMRGQEFYRTSLGEVEIAASVGGGVQKRQPGETGRERRLLSAGLELGYGGFLGALAYGMDEKGQRYEQQHRIAAGLSYSIKRFSFGPAFAVNWREGTEARAGNAYVLGFGGSYSLAPGIDATGALQHSRSPQSRGGGGREDEGTAGLFGISLSF